jgi:hypothetical protein
LWRNAPFQKKKEGVCVDVLHSRSVREGSRRRLLPRHGIGFFVLFLIALFFVLSINIAFAQTTVPVTLNLISIDYGTCTDGPGDPPELFFTGFVGDRFFFSWDGLSSPPPDETPNPWNLNSTIRADIDPADNPVEITLNLADYPATLSDPCDISPTPGATTLTLSLDLNNCSISGDVAGTCNGIYDISGDNAARSSTVTLSVYAESSTPTTGTYIRCMHSPTWPKHGENVTITAEALDGSLNPVIADSLGAYLEGQIGIPTSNVSTVTRIVQFSELAGKESFQYQCEMTDNGITIGTGWREVKIGGLDPLLQPISLFETVDLNRAVPVLNTGSKRDSIDVVFIADSTSYPQGANDPAFQADVYDAILTGYYSEAIYLEWQQYLNFWIALDTGTWVGPDQCDYNVPLGNSTSVFPAWFTVYSWADTGAMLHTHSGGCAYRSSRILASVVDTGFRILLHESGHSPFHLSDEYSNGNTSYFVPNPYPNIYRSEADCQNDATNLLPWDPARVVTDCHSFPGRPGQTWWKSDVNNDLMNNNQTINGADLRRIDYIFDRCTRGNC